MRQWTLDYMIKAIIFDLGKVLVPFDFKRAYERMAQHCTVPAVEVPELLRPHDVVSRFECGQVEPREFVKELSDILSLTCNYDEFCDIFSSVFYPETLIPDSMLEKLRERYRLVLLSNTNAIHFEILEKNYPLLRHFHEHVLSFRVGAMKPSPRIYQAAVSAAQCEPGECFFTDDIRAYVDAARKMGIDAVQFESKEQIERELRARGVEV